MRVEKAQDFFCTNPFENELTERLARTTSDELKTVNSEHECLDISRVCCKLSGRAAGDPNHQQMQQDHDDHSRRATSVQSNAWRPEKATVTKNGATSIASALSSLSNLCLCALCTNDVCRVHTCTKHAHFTCMNNVPLYICTL